MADMAAQANKPTIIMSSNQKKKVVKVEDDVPVCIFECLMDAAMDAGLQSTSGIKKRINTNYTVD